MSNASPGLSLPLALPAPGVLCTGSCQGTVVKEGWMKECPVFHYTPRPPTGMTSSHVPNEVFILQIQLVS
jgi:hypothetical protein